MNEFRPLWTDIKKCHTFHKRNGSSEKYCIGNSWLFSQFAFPYKPRLREIIIGVLLVETTTATAATNSLDYSINHHLLCPLALSSSSPEDQWVEKKLSVFFYLISNQQNLWNQEHDESKLSCCSFHHFRFAMTAAEKTSSTWRSARAPPCHAVLQWHEKKPLRSILLNFFQIGLEMHKKSALIIKLSLLS